MTTIPFKEATPVLRLQNLNVKFAGSPVSVVIWLVTVANASAQAFSTVDWGSEEKAGNWATKAE